MILLPLVLTLAWEPLSLDAALARADSQSPVLRALRERARASASRGESIERQKLPRVGVELIAQKTDNPAAAFAHRLNAGQLAAGDLDIARLNAPNALSHVGSSLFVEAPIDIFGRLKLATAAHAAGQRAMTQNVREAESAVAFQVTEAYLGAVLAREAMLATERSVTAARSRETITQARFEEGVALRSDVLRVRVLRRAREADLASRHADLDAAEAMLARLIGAADGIRFDLTDGAKPLETMEPLEIWKARAAAARPALLAAREQSEATALSVRLEGASRRPEIAAQARLMDDRTPQGGARSWVVGAMLRWNLLDATRDKRVAAAQADERAAVEDERDEAYRVRFEVEAAFSHLAAAKDRLAAAQGGAEEGREALRVVQERRAQGLATLTDELETEAAAFAAELEEINAARNAALAEAALRRAAGFNPGSAVQ